MLGKQISSEQGISSEPHGVWRSCVESLRAHRALLDNAGSLVATTLVTGLAGFVFWWLAARLLPLESVGYGSAAVSAMALLGTFGMLGLNTVLIGELSRRPGSGGLVSASLLTSGAASGLLGTGFVVVAPLVAPRSFPYLDGPGKAALFVVGVTLTGASLVLDEALIGRLLGHVQLWRNAVMAGVRIAALAVIAIALHDLLGIGVLAAWIAAVAVSFLPVALLLHLRGIGFLHRPAWGVLRRLTTTTASHNWFNGALQAPRLALPLVVTALVSPGAEGAFYVAWVGVGMANIVPSHLTTVLYAVSAADVTTLRRKIRFTLRISLVGGLVGVPILIVVAHPLLRLFGSAYASQATVPLQLLALGYFPSMIKSHFAAVCRVRDRIAWGACFATAGGALRLGGAAIGAMSGGLVGLSLGLLAAMCLEAIALFPTVVAAALGKADTENGTRPAHPTEASGRPAPAAALSLPRPEPTAREPDALASGGVRVLPSVSVVIPTYNRVAMLPAAVAPILADPATHELVVVVDGCEDGSLELLEELAMEDGRLLPLFIDNRGRQGAVEAGLARCSGDVVLFLDDDEVAVLGLVTGHANHHAGTSGLMVVGYTPTAGDGGRPLDGPARLYTLAYEGQCRGWEERPDTILLDLYGGNCSMRRADCLRVGLVSPEYPDLFHEDQDFGLRCSKAGVTAIFDRRLVATHAYKRSVDAFLHDAYSSGMGQWLLHQIHEDLLGPFDPSTFSRSVPAPARLAVRAASSPSARTALMACLRGGARFSGRLHWFAVESLLLRVGRRVQERAGALAAAAALGEGGTGLNGLARRGGQALEASHA